MEMACRLDATAGNAQVKSACHDGEGRATSSCPVKRVRGPGRPLMWNDRQGRGRHAPRSGVLARKFALPRQHIQPQTVHLEEMACRLDATAVNAQVLSACHDGGGGRGRHAPRSGVLASKFLDATARNAQVLSACHDGEGRARCLMQ
jgi:hypothetical protein